MGEMEPWCVLRCSAARTLQLVASLREAGFAAWTPVETVVKLLGKARRPGEVEKPILSEHVFVPFENLNEMLSLARRPTLNFRVWDTDTQQMVTKGHPHFSVFRQHGHIRPLPERSLTPLRELEAKLHALTERRRDEIKLAGPSPKFAKGQMVRITGAGFDGLNLTVLEANDGKTVKLCHPNWTWIVEISAWKLQPIQLHGGLPEQATAKAA